MRFKGLLVLASLAATPAVAKEYIVKFRSDAALKAVVQTKSVGSIPLLSTSEVGNLATVELGKSSKQEEAKKILELMQRPDVAYVVENIKMHAFAIPDDPRFNDQWSLAKVRASEAWDKQVGSNNVVVAVIDTGIDWNHPDLRDNIWTNSDEIAGNNRDDDNNGFVDDVRGWDFRDNDADPTDLTGTQNPGHGTHCAGIVGARGNNGTGISGMAQVVKLMPVRFLGADGSGDLMNGARSIDYAVNNGAHIISASWGAAVAASGAAPIIEAISRANDAGVIFVAAAANDGANNDTREMYPANADYPNVISVAASNSSDGKPSWSNFGKSKVHVASPGEGILSTLPNSGYDNLSGTSMATPLVSGLVALMKSSQMNLTGAQAKALLQTTGAEVAIETACNCRVDAAAVLEAMEDNALTPVPAAKTYSVGATDNLSAIGGAGGYTFTSANPEVISVTAQGTLQAVALGETQVTVTDSAGGTAQTLTMRVANQEQGGEECPLGDPMLCQLMCIISPDLPWCSK